MRRAGIAKPRRGPGAIGRQPHAGAEAGEAARQAHQRQRPGRRRAAIDGAVVLRQRHAGQAFDGVPNQALHRMRRLGVVRAVGAGGASDAEKARVLARAIVVDRARRTTATRQRLRRRLVNWPVRAAFERGGVEPRGRKHARCCRHMIGLAGMRGAGQRQLLGAKAVEVSSTAFHQRERLQRLHRRARIDRGLDVAKRQHWPAAGIDHGDGAGVPAFDQRPAQDLDQNGITHW